MIALHPEEKLVKTVRKHWLVFGLANLHLPVLALLPLVFPEMFLSFLSSWSWWQESFDLSTLGAFFYALWLLGLWVILALDWTNYYLDVWYLTTERLIDVEQKDIFSRDEATTRLDNIQDVTVETSGLLATLFHFGVIKVQTAGESREFVMENVSQPEQVRQLLLSLSRDLIEKPQAVEVVGTRTP